LQFYSRMFDHYIITRFNLKKEGWDTSKHNIPVLTETWLTNRFVLFERFCFSSVKAQENQNFKWLVYFDVSTPEIFKKRIEELAEEFPNFQPCYADGMEQFVPSIQEELKKSTAQYVITSRLDNDDCLAKTYVNEVQQRFVQKDHWALDFIDGYTLQVSPDYKLGKRLQRFNPFISLIEVNDNPQSVWQRIHGAWKRDPNLETIKNSRQWMSIIHAENKVNDFAGFGRVDPAVLHDFITDPTDCKQIQDALIPETQWKIKSMSNSIKSHEKSFSKSLKRSLRLGLKKK